MDSFEIFFVAENKKNVINIHKDINSYISKKIIENILIPKSIIVKTNWNFKFAVSFMDCETPIVVLPTYSSKKDLIKVYTAPMNVNLFLNAKDNDVNSIYVSKLSEYLKLFFMSNYKSVKQNDMDYFYNSLDFNFIKSFDYPVAKENIFYGIIGK